MEELSDTRKRIYIAGKVTGEEPMNCYSKFAMATAELFLKGYEAVNPLNVVGKSNDGWKADMKKCIAALLTCDAIYMLPCWTKSRGATLERFIASSVGIEIIESKQNT